jgi:hypothetical protein
MSVPALRLVPEREPAGTSATERLGLVALTPGLVLPKREWLVDGLWPEKAVGFIGGPPKAMKSWLTLDMAISLATGKPFLGRTIRRPGPVLYFLGEDFRGDVHERADRLLAGAGLTREALKRRLYFSEGLGSLEQGQRVLLDAVKELEPIMVILDPLARFLTDAEENSASEMRPINNFVRRDLAREAQTAVCIVHHTNKGDGNLRGTSDLRALSETMLLFSEASHGRVKIDVEMRGAVAPEPFQIGLEDLKDGAVRWKLVDAATGAADRLAKAGEILARAGDKGITLDAARRELVMRGQDVAGTLFAAGGRQVKPKGRWYWPECLPGGTLFLAA